MAEHADLTGSHHLEQLVLQSHVVLRLETNAGTEDVGEASALLGKSIDDRSARWRERGLTRVSVWHL